MILNKLAIIIIRAYQIAVSPFFGSKCRFYPSCSTYAIDVFKVFPIHKALWYAFTRIIKCHPFNKGGYDPIPNMENQ